MDIALLQLIKIITTLYYCSLLKVQDNTIKDEIELVLKSVKVNNKQVIDIPGNENNVIENLKNTIEWIINASNVVFTKENIIQRLKINLINNNDYVKIIEDSFTEIADENEIKIKINELMSELRFEKNRNDIKDTIASAYYGINFNSDKSDTKNVIETLSLKLDALRSASNNEIKGRTGRIDFSDKEEIRKALLKGKETFSNAGLIRTGLQGFDRAFGGGIPRGYFGNVGGITGNYKTGWLRDLPLFIPHFNPNPWCWEKDRKPLVSRISFETTESQDIIALATRLIEHSSNKEIEPDTLSVEQATDLLYDHFNNNGYQFILECFDPLYFSIYDLFKIYDEYYKSGYEIHFASIDYLMLIAHNTMGDRADSKILRTYEMARNYLHPKGATTFTGAQLNSEAKHLAQDKNPRVAEIFASGFYYTDCKSLRDKFDIEIITHIYEHPKINENGRKRKFLTMAKGKHRGGELLKIPSEYHYWTYEFDRIGGIRFDGGDEPRCMTKIPDLTLSSTDSW